MYDPANPNPTAPADPSTPADPAPAPTTPVTEPAIADPAPTPAADPAKTSLVDDRDVAAAHTPAAVEVYDRDRDEDEPDLEPGELVTFTYKDAGGVDVVRTGIVTRLTDEHDPGNGQGAVVAWLGDLSDPIPLDQLERTDR